MNLFTFYSFKVCISIYLIISFSSSMGFGKLLFKNKTLQHVTLQKMFNCLSTEIYESYEGRPIIFPTNELGDSFGEQLIIIGLNATVVICHDCKDKHKQVIILQPRKDISDFGIYNQILAGVARSSCFFIIWPSETLLSTVSELHAKFWRRRILRVGSFIPTNSGDLNIYTYFPYTEGHCGNGYSVQQVNKCTSKGLENNFNVFSGQNKIKNFHGCNIKCFGNTQFPESRLIQHPNGTWKVEGNIVDVLETLQSHYNLTLTYVNIFNDKYGWFYYNTSMQMVIEKHENMSYEFGFGQYTILNALNNPTLDYSFASNPECIGWAVPLYAGKHPSLSIIYLVEFPFFIWCLLGLAIFVAVKFVIIAKHVEGINLNLSKLVHHYTMIAFSIISESPKVKSKLVSLNLFLFMWSIWGFVVRCFYEASLGSIMAVPIPVQDLKSHRDFLESNLRVAGGVKMYELLKKDVTSKTMKLLANKFEILPPTSSREILNKIYKTQNLAVLQPNRLTAHGTLEYGTKEGRDTLAVVMRPSLVKTFASPILILKGSIMANLLYNFLNRIFEAGLVKHWKTKYAYHNIKEPAKNRPLSLHKIQFAFIIYLTGIVIAFVGFFLEMVHFKLTEKSRAMKKNVPLHFIM